MSQPTQDPMQAALRYQLYAVVAALLGATLLVAVMMGFGVHLSADRQGGELELTPAGNATQESRSQSDGD